MLDEIAFYYYLLHADNGGLQYECHIVCRLTGGNEGCSVFYMRCADNVILFSSHESVNFPFSFVMVPAIKEESFADKRDMVTNSMGLYSLSVTSPEIIRFCAWEMIGTIPNINNNHTFMIVS